jgi:hypothetical protein
MFNQVSYSLMHEENRAHICLNGSLLSVVAVVVVRNAH